MNLVISNNFSLLQSSALTVLTSRNCLWRQRSQIRHVDVDFKGKPPHHLPKNKNMGILYICNKEVTYSETHNGLWTEELDSTCLNVNVNTSLLWLRNSERSFSFSIPGFILQQVILQQFNVHLFYNGWAPRRWLFLKKKSSLWTEYRDV